ncbi:CopG family antitoxin [Nodosilinea sp. PGN35]|uniref:CopG family antitoxin n=1 Tax=Nodosilinea sp. PGN35 TaxID=3020489 RepID=UPI002413DCB5|nr:BrnA antitoxin family protein [Nodosilinea sp. TSF1-S3]
MRDEYDFSASVENPYTKKLKKQITIRLEEGVVDYFKDLAEEVGIPYQSLINLYLQDCVRSQRKLSLEWVSSEGRS